MIRCKIGQAMLSGPLKSALIAVLALMLSVGHSACAGIVSGVAGPSAAQQESFPHHHDEMSGVHGSGGQHKHKDGTSHAPCGPDSSDCPHCNAAQFYKSSSKIEFAASLEWSTLEHKTYSDTEIETRIAGKPALSRFTLQWRAPPEMTPVSMKVRLLN